ncbi:MAG: DUF998 domain-containing protein [Acidimicrobiales bacterium]
MPVRPAPSPPVLARACLMGIGIYVVIDVILKFLRPGYSLLYNAESDYGRGPWFWVMDANFLLRCALSLALVLALARQTGHDRRLKAGLVLLVVWAACSGLLAFFADNIEGQPVKGSGGVHVLLAAVAFLCVAIAAVLLSVRLRAVDGWASITPALLALALAGVVAFLALGATAGHRHLPGGLVERIFLALELAWIGTAAASVIRISRRPVQTAP